MSGIITLPDLKARLRGSRLPLVRSLYEAAGTLKAIPAERERAKVRARTLARIDAEVENAIIMAVQYIREITEGDVAEFGVYNGRYARIECREMAAFGQTRALHLFDSFAGHDRFTDDDKRAPEVASGKTVTGAHAGQPSPDALLRELRRTYANVHVHPGFFNDTLPAIPADARFVMIVLDANVFSPSWAVLDHLFSHGHVLDGAMLMFPGFNLSRASPDHGVRRAWAQAIEKFAISYSDEGRYYSKGAKFIVHGYRR